MRTRERMTFVEAKALAEVGDDLVIEEPFHLERDAG